MRRLLAVMCALLCVATVAGAQERQTEHTLKIGPGFKRPAATIADMEWLAGTWRGEGLGGQSEEIWSAPRGGVMMGMYRHLKGDAPVFYEFLTLSESDGALVIRLKHFNPDLTGWEEREESVSFPLAAIRDGAYYFEGMTFVPGADGTLTIYLAIRGKDGQVREETFRYRRQPPG